MDPVKHLRRGQVDLQGRIADRKLKQRTICVDNIKVQTYIYAQTPGGHIHLVGPQLNSRRHGSYDLRVTPTHDPQGWLADACIYEHASLRCPKPAAGDRDWRSEPCASRHKVIHHRRSYHCKAHAVAG